MVNSRNTWSEPVCAQALLVWAPPTFTALNALSIAQGKEGGGGDSIEATQRHVTSSDLENATGRFSEAKIETSTPHGIIEVD